MIGMPALGYRPGVDGIRALAVAAVLLFHLDRLPGGNLGVDAFFVVSGWLITSKLLSDVDRSGTVNSRTFWAGRLRRLMPASMAVLVTIAVVWPLADIEVPSLRRDIGWAAVGLSNWGTISGGGDYWARFGEPSPVTHFWSLAIEQQFYLVWPLVLLAIIAVTRSVRHAVAWVCVVGALGSIVLMNVMFDPTDPTATYMNTFTRAHTLLIGAAAGALTAVLADGHLRFGRAARRMAPIGVIVALTIMLASSAGSVWLFRWGFPLFAAAMAVVVVAVADGAAEPIMASRPMRWLADRSYGLYLWHWPVFLLLSASRVGVTDSGLSMALLDVTRVAVAVALADASYRWLETPIRRRHRIAGWQAPVAAVSSLSVLALLLVTVVPQPSSNSDTSVVALPPPTETTSVVPASPTTPPASVAGGDAPSPATSTPSAPPAEPAPPLRVLVAGDSMAVDLSEALLERATSHPDELVAGSASFGGCGLSAATDGRLHEFTNVARERELLDISGCVEQWSSIPTRVRDEVIDVVLVNIGPWDALDMHLADGRVVSVADETGRQLVADAFAEFASQVEAAGAKVIWVTPADAHLGWGEFDDPVNDPVRWDAVRRIIAGLDVMQVDLPGWLVAEGLDGPDGRPDGVHLAPGLNERFVAEVVAPMLDTVRQA
ncbi:MAG TPA: acyltransferase family protein [Ilumatobacteraceae bacterium]|nr:acyltransferase family protein [Ilumatobacteraceae bacterium]